MKKTDWLIAGLLIVMGLGCLTVSATTMWGTESIKTYLKTLIHLCLWMGLPISVIGIFLLLKRRKDK